MTTQQAYEMMRTYMTRPGAQMAGDESGNCFYETQFPDGVQRCAVGCVLTPDTLLRTGKEQWCDIPIKDYSGSVRGLMDYYDVPELQFVSLDFLSDAQNVHDKSENWAKGKFDVAKLDAVAKKHGLTVVSGEQKVAEGAPRELVPA